MIEVLHPLPTHGRRLRRSSNPQSRRRGRGRPLPWPQIFTIDEELLALITTYEQLLANELSPPPSHTFPRALLLAFAAGLFVWLMIGAATLMLLA